MGSAVLILISWRLSLLTFLPGWVLCGLCPISLMGRYMGSAIWWIAPGPDRWRRTETPQAGYLPRSLRRTSSGNSCNILLMELRGYRGNHSSLQGLDFRIWKQEQKSGQGKCLTNLKLRHCFGRQLWKVVCKRIFVFLLYNRHQIGKSRSLSPVRPTGCLLTAPLS